MRTLLVGAVGVFIAFALLFWAYSASVSRGEEEGRRARGVAARCGLCGFLSVRGCGIRMRRMRHHPIDSGMPEAQRCNQCTARVQ